MPAVAVAAAVIPTSAVPTGIWIVGLHLSGVNAVRKRDVRGQI